MIPLKLYPAELRVILSALNNLDCTDSAVTSKMSPSKYGELVIRLSKFLYEFEQERYDE